MAAPRKKAAAPPRRAHDAADRDAQGAVDARPATPRAARGSSPARSFSATSSTTRSSIRATARRCSPRRAPATSGRRSSARPTADARGRRPRSRRHSSRGQRTHGRSHVLADAGARERARRLVRGHVAAGAVPLGRWRRRRGPASTASTSTRSARHGAAATRTARRTARSCTRSSSTRATRSICTSGCRAAASSNRSTRGARLEAAQQGRARGLPAGSRSGVRARSALRAAASARNPDRLYQQNHCGIYRLDRPADRWTDIGAAMPKSVGSIGFPMVLHPRDPDTLWVFPMDGTSVWPRISPGGKPAAYRSVNGGKTWQRQATGHAEGAGVVDGQAPGDDGRPGAERGRLLRHDERRSLGQPRRGAELEMPGAASAAHLRGRVRRERAASAEPHAALPQRPMNVRIPGPAALVHAPVPRSSSRLAARRRPTLGDALAASSTRAFPGCAFASSTNRTRCGRTSSSSSTAR